MATAMSRTATTLPMPGRPARRRWPRRLRLLGIVMVLWVLALAVGATPAAAHGVGGVEPTNYQTRILAVEPAVSGLSVEVVEAGARLRVRNTTGREVIVLGYAGEPYLRLGPDGVFENRRSPATFLNRVRIAPAAPPADADPTAPPAWRRIGDGDTVAWYDHRAHWMAASDPPAVKAAPDQRHVVIPRWQVPLRASGQQLQVTGDVRWIPGPNPWPWLAVAVGCLLLVVVAARLRHPMLLAGLVALLVLVDLIHTAGIWAGSTPSVATKASASLPSVVGWALGGLAVRRLVGSNPARGHVFVLVAAVLLLLVGGLSDLNSLSASQLAVALSTPLTRSVIAVTLGLAGGLTLLTLRPPSPATHQGTGDPATERGTRGHTLP
jgi:hypothetical protein